MLNLIVGWIVFVLVVGLGFIALVIPGLFLLVSLFYWPVYVAIEDNNFITGFTRSWRLTRGHRLRLFTLWVVFVLIATVVNAMFTIPASLIGGVGSVVISTIGSVLVTVFSLATMAAAFNQLRELEEEPDFDTDLDPGVQPMPS